MISLRTQQTERLLPTGIKLLLKIPVGIKTSNRSYNYVKVDYLLLIPYRPAANFIYDGFSLFFSGILSVFKSIIKSQDCVNQKRVFLKCFFKGGNSPKDLGKSEILKLV